MGVSLYMENKEEEERRHLLELNPVGVQLGLLRFLHSFAANMCQLHDQGSTLPVLGFQVEGKERRIANDVVVFMLELREVIINSNVFSISESYIYFKFDFYFYFFYYCYSFKKRTLTMIYCKI